MSADLELLEKLRAEEAQPFEGWDFSRLRGRMLEEAPPWDYASIVRDALPRAGSLLDMGTGGGEFLGGLGPLPADTHATEGYAPNVPIARSRLGPLGIAVHEVDDDARLTLPSAAFDLVINRHESYDSGEVHRVLRPRGRFVTQQVGGTNDVDLNELLEAPNPDFGMLDWDLAHARAQLEAVGLTVVRAEESFPAVRFTDAAAVVYYLKAVPWQIPDFTVDRYFERLRELDRRAEAEGHIGVRSHRFLLVATK